MWLNKNPDSRAEYRSRMHRVLAHIDAHLDEPLDLSSLAGVAHFSPFHFHRLFAAWTGETLGDYLRRGCQGDDASPSGRDWSARSLPDGSALRSSIQRSSYAADASTPAALPRPKPLRLRRPSDPGPRRPAALQ